jgi:hypothetical protein
MLGGRQALWPLELCDVELAEVTHCCIPFPSDIGIATPEITADRKPD